MKTLKIFAALTFAAFIISCGTKEKKPPVDLSNIDNVEDICVPYSEYGGVKVIPVKLNGEPMNMIYDTGCSGLHLSLLELQTLYKNGKFSSDDIIGSSYSQIASGEIVENGTIIIKEVEIGGEEGIVLHNVEATVALNQEAPILLGNGVLDKLASIKVDNVNKTINFTRY